LEVESLSRQSSATICITAGRRGIGVVSQLEGEEDELAELGDDLHGQQDDEG
jgi:hypothetical protein